MPSEDGRTRYSSSYFIKNYDKIIRAGYITKKNSDYRIKIELMRACFDMCFHIFCTFFNSANLLGSWNKDDFNDVARFMIYDYGIEECLHMPDMGDGLNYPDVRKLFNLPAYIDSEQIKFFKEKLKEFKNN